MNAEFNRAGYSMLSLEHGPESGVRTADGWGYQICRKEINEPFLQVVATAFQSARGAALWFERNQLEFDLETGCYNP